MLSRKSNIKRILHQESYNPMSSHLQIHHQGNCNLHIRVLYYSAQYRKLLREYLCPVRKMTKTSSLSKTEPQRNSEKRI